MGHVDVAFYKIGALGTSKPEYSRTTPPRRSTPHRLLTLDVPRLHDFHYAPPPDAPSRSRIRSFISIWGSAWDLLGITPQASAADILRAFGRAALANHPDKAPSTDPAVVAEWTGTGQGKRNPCCGGAARLASGGPGHVMFPLEKSLAAPGRHGVCRP